MTRTLALRSMQTNSASYLRGMPRGLLQNAAFRRFAPCTVAAVLCAGLLAWHGLAGLAVMSTIGFAAVLSSIAGFAFSPICGAMLFHLVPEPVRAVQIIMICSVANQAAMTWSLRRDIDWPGMRRYLLAGSFGVPVGVWLLLSLQRGQYTIFLGAFLIVFSATMLLRKPFTILGDHRLVDAAVAFAGGIMGGACGFPSGLLAMWSGSRGWNKARQRAVCQPFILSMQVWALCLITLARHGASFEPQSLLYVPASLLGTMAGLAIYRALSDRHFARAVNCLLLLSGFSFVL